MNPFFLSSPLSLVLLQRESRFEIIPLALYFMKRNVAVKLNLAYFLFKAVAAHFQSYRRLMQRTTINVNANRVICHLHSLLTKSSSLFSETPVVN